jgi:phosphodiesterase/alkaline phosphatase D-like protein
MKHAMIFVMLFGLAACKDDDPEKEPMVVTTGDIFTITGRGTVAGGTIESPGGYTATEAGIVYGTASSPTVDDVKEIADPFAPTEFPYTYTVTIRGGLPAGTIYYRAYAVAGDKIFYGQTRTRN